MFHMVMKTFQVIAESLSEEEIMGLKQMFKNMDTDNSGTITFEELKVGLAKQGSKLPEHEIRQLIEAVSLLFLSKKIQNSSRILLKFPKLTRRSLCSTKFTTMEGYLVNF